MAFNIWGDLPQVTVKQKTIRPADKPKSIDVERMLREIGENGTALNTTRMELGKLKPMFKGFNPEQISSVALDKVGKQLYSYGLIDNLTADLLGRAALEFDKYGNPSRPDEEINALEFFARQIDEMKNKSYKGDKYAQMLLPDYTRAVHVMKCLQEFGATGESFGSAARKEREARGEIPKQQALKPIR